MGDWKRAALDLLFPPLCMACRAPVGEPGFCAGCWSQITFLDGPLCDCCGLPFAADPGIATLCAACHAQKPVYASARAILRYDENSRGAILALKHADRLDLVPGFSRWLGRAGRELLNGCDVIVPVPLHPWRLWRRRYNQAAELGRRLGRDWAIPFDAMALARTRPTPSQGEMPSRKARRRNMLAAFAVPAGARPVIAGRRVLLVDDVMTTGATVEACARALLRAGAQKVDVLALARVVRATEVTI